ncbi:MAG: PorV/PorQ family protein [Bacteroidetes bacterium]|nr:PorV/PorQ family protein [Bacteroidota bacterium]
MVKRYLILSLAFYAGIATVLAGNKERVGQAGATQLLINPWTRSSGWCGANTASVRGIEATYLNVAGLAFTPKTELLFTRTQWLKGTDININAFGLSQRIGETSVLGLNFMSMDMGDIEITTTDQPEGGIGTFSPQFFNMGLSYAKAFSDNIYGGLNLKIISEGIADVKARGVALDAGIQYVTGKWNRVKFGIALKNVGPRMTYRGDGLSFNASVLSTGTILTAEQRSSDFELPSMVNIGGSYDFYLKKDTAEIKMHRLTVAGNFVSNSFSKDQYVVGLEYGLKSFLMLRAGYLFEDGIHKEDERTTAFTGPHAGFGVEVPFGKEKKSTFGIDYSYRATNPFNGVHSFGARLSL